MNNGLQYLPHTQAFLLKTGGGGTGLMARLTRYTPDGVSNEPDVSTRYEFDEHENDNRGAYSYSHRHYTCRVQEKCFCRLCRKDNVRA